jgi:hypothetical protein
MAADSSFGNDAIACCGTGTNGPCQSLTRSMQLVAAARAANVTLRASIGDAGGDWTALELFPVVLGWNVELSAPGVFFYDPFDELETFDIDSAAYGQGGDAGGRVSIVGAPGVPVFIGRNLAGQHSRDPSILQVETGNTLYLANADLESNAIFQTTALTVEAGAGLVVGQDNAGAVTGTVVIGNALGHVTTDGWNGIVCVTDLDAGSGGGCDVRDVAMDGTSLVIEGQNNWGLFASDFSTVSLTSAPVFGVAPSATGFGTCPSKRDATASSSSAILLAGTGRLTLGGATLQCIAGDGIDLVASSTGSPQLTLSGSTLQNIGGAALYAVAGAAKVSSSTFQYNYFGAWQDGQATIDLGAATPQQGNTAICCDEREATTPEARAIGVCVVNTSTFGAELQARNVAWDSAGPDIFSCIPDRNDPPRDLANCHDFTCQSATCSPAPVDALYDGPGTVAAADPRVATLTCGSL